MFLPDGRGCDLELLLLIHPLGVSLVATNSYTLGIICSAGAITGRHIPFISIYVALGNTQSV